MTNSEAPLDIAGEVRRLADELDGAYQRERRTRKRLLRIHGITAFVCGYLILQFGAAYTLEDRFGIWLRPFLGVVGLSAGILLWWSQHCKPWRCRTELIGVWLVGLWDMVMAIAFTCLNLPGVRSWQFLNLFELKPQMHDSATPYPVMVYLGFSLMLWTVHLPAVWRDYRCGR